MHARTCVRQMKTVRLVRRTLPSRISVYARSFVGDLAMSGYMRECHRRRAGDEPQLPHRRVAQPGRAMSMASIEEAEKLRSDPSHNQCQEHGRALCTAPEQPSKAHHAIRQKFDATTDALQYVRWRD